MDFLRTISGPSNEQVRKLAVPVQVGGISLNVLHTLLCLESRLANVAVIPGKRVGNGIMQSVWAVNIAKAYLLQILKSGDTECDQPN